ncbi:hypothetical protein IID23_03510 [Patescibacteria group bacterium]|nr:hypothetical protein [Patescibacteria group bacterium]
MLRKVEGGTLVYQKRTSITLVGRTNEVKRLAGLELERFMKLSKQRAWNPEQLPQRREMFDLGYLLQSGETNKVTSLLLGSFATELTEPIYVREGLKAAGDNLTSRIFFGAWGEQERCHHQGLEKCLEDSGLMTSTQIVDYKHECAEAPPWSFYNQTGHDDYDIVWATAYALLQEGQTRLTYTGIREAVWVQYGSPRDTASGRKQYPGVCGVLGLIATDEGAHQAFFLRMMRIYLRFFPDRALEALTGVIKGYSMPVVHIPNAEEFMYAIISAKLYSAKWVMTDVQHTATKSLGLENRKAARAAFRNFGGLLDEDAVVQILGEKIEMVPEGCTVYDLNTQGEFVRVKAVA